MPKKGVSYSSELRSQVIAALEAGLSGPEVAAQYGLSPSTVRKWALRFRRSGSVAAKRAGGDRFSALKHERAWVLARIAAEPDLTVAQLQRQLGMCGVSASYRAVKTFLKREKIELK